MKEAIVSGSRLSPNDLRSISDKWTEPPKPTQRKPAHRRRVVFALCLIGLLVGWFCFSTYRGWVFHYMSAKPVPTSKSIAVLPFENISENKEETYFADGVQDEILANVARISALKVISRSSVMQYRPDTRRDLRQIASALGVANILEGTVRRAGNRVRINIELVDTGTDHMIWSETYDRDLTDIFAIQSEIAETVARKLTATLSPEEKKRIEAKPTDNLEAYDLYLRAKELMLRFGVLVSMEPLEGPLAEAISLLEQAVRLDPKFTLASASWPELTVSFMFWIQPQNDGLWERRQQRVHCACNPISLRSTWPTPITLVLATTIKITSGAGRTRDC